MLNIVPPGSNKVALPEPLINFVLPDIVLTYAIFITKLEKYFFSFNIVCVVALSRRHTSPLLILNPTVNWGFLCK